MDAITKLNEIIIDSGISADRAADIAEKMRQEYGGVRVYIPVLPRFAKQDVINDLSKSGDHKKVARKYGISLSTTYRVTKQVRKSRK